MSRCSYPQSRLHRSFIASGLMALAASALAQPTLGVPPLPPDAAAAPRVPPARPLDASAMVQLDGTVARWLTNPNGDVDGLLLSDGTQVSFPPHLGAGVAESVKLRGTVQLNGWRDGAVFRATTIQGAGGRAVRDDGPPAVPPWDPAALQELAATGSIDTLLHGPRGEVNGVVLQSGEQVRFAPHVGLQYASLLQRGMTLSARGYGTRNGFGTSFEATAIGDSANNLQQVFAGPRPPGLGMPPVRPAS